jgi:hypothetical protein
VKSSRLIAVLVVSLLALAWTAGSAGAQGPGTPKWAPAASAPIHPGVQTVSQSGQCTANFVFYDATDIYIGQAAHCTGLGAASDTNGCDTDVLPLGTPVEVGGARSPGRVVYNSWQTMHDVGETNDNVCLGNDFALIRLEPGDHPRVNPSVPFWGGPKGLDPSTSGLETVYGYGNSGLRAGLTPLSPKIGFATGDQLDGWNHNVYTITPGIPGDSGSAYLGSNGGAIGVLSTFSLTLANQVTDLSRALNYMRQHTDLDAVQLANGTEAFSPLL